MIQSIFDGIFNALEYLANLLPHHQVIFEMQGMATLLDLIYKSSFFVPYRTLFTCLAIGMSFYSMKFTISAINWLIKKIPLIN